MTKTFMGNPCKRGHDGRRYISGHCVECQIDHAATRNARPDVKRREAERQRKKKYGILPLEYNFMFASQQFRCAACEADEPGGKGEWHTDHIHGTKIVRAILCHGCNVSIGLCKESPAILRALADHIEQHQHLCPTKQNSIQPTSATGGHLKLLPLTAPNAKPQPDYSPAMSSRNTNEPSRRSA